MGPSESVSRLEVSSRAEPALGKRPDVRPHLYEALALLLQAHDYAIELDKDIWDLAVELPVLRAARLTNSDIRWLAAEGYIDHGIEITSSGDHVRQFRFTPLPTLTDACCLVLTLNGAAVARQVRSAESVQLPELARGIGPSAALDEETRRPRWDDQRRQLRMGSELVKQFNLPSPNQETVLAAFEEEGWPPRIDDPLHPVIHLDSRRRLQDTIKALNRKQKRYLIRFRGDGSGEGIRWEPVATHDGASPAWPVV